MYQQKESGSCANGILLKVFRYDADLHRLNPHFLGHVLILGFGLFFLFLLKSVLFALALTASKALGGKPLITERCPGTEILATLAPLDFEPTLADYPYVHVAQSAQALVLGWDDSITVTLFTHQVVRSACSSFSGFFVLFILVSIGRGACLSTHDTTPHAFGEVNRLFLRHVYREIHETSELGDRHILYLFNVTLEFGGDRGLQGYTLALGLSHTV